MSENNSIDTQGIIKTIKEVLPQTTNETDGALSTLVGWFNNVILYPVKKANITYRYKLEQFEDDLKNKIQEIPEECVHEPPLQIAGPTLEALKYTFDEDEIRLMYINLLASSVDIRKDEYIHPSYVDIIKRMDSYDADLFQYLASVKGYIPAINPNVHLVGTNKSFVNSMPDWFFECPNRFNDIFKTSSSLIRLSNFGLIELMFDRTAGETKEEELKADPRLQEILIRYKTHKAEVDIIATNSIICVNDFGKQFAKVCLPI